MKLTRKARIKGEGGLLLLLIVLLIIAGIVWWLYSSRSKDEQNARAFAAEVVKRVAVDYDEKFLHIHMSPDAQVQFLKSWRDRLMDQLRSYGVPAQPLDVQGEVEFNSYFFEPHGTFRAQLKYPTTSAQLEVNVSRGMAVWQVDSVNVIWTPPPGGTPTPSPSPVPTPSPTPQQKLKRKAR
jgi:hypothetical protein